MTVTVPAAELRFGAAPPDVYFDEVDSPLGTFLLAGAGDTLVAARLPDAWRREDVPAAWIRDAEALAEPARQLDEYFDGSRTEFRLRFAPAGTPFQRSVWDALCDVPFGATASYRDVASAIGNERATRAVGLANNRNPIALFIPCHRVIGANGSLTGYGGGLEMKSWLLDHERQVASRVGQ